MRNFLIRLVPALALAATTAPALAASYHLDFTGSGSPDSGISPLVSGDAGASLLPGDRVTVNFSAPGSFLFYTPGAAMWDWAYRTGAYGQMDVKVDYSFSNGGTVLASGSITALDICCASIRLPLYTSPAGVWDRLSYTTTILRQAGSVILGSNFYYLQEGATYVMPSGGRTGDSVITTADGASYIPVVPEPGVGTLFGTGLVVMGIGALRRHARR